MLASENPELIRRELLPEEEDEFYYNWETVGTPTIDINSIFIMAIAYFGMFFMLFAMMLQWNLIITIIIVVLVVFGMFFIGDRIVRRAEKAVIGQDIIEMEITDKYGLHRYCGTRILKEKPFLLKKLRLEEYILNTLAANREEMRRDIERVEDLESTIFTNIDSPISPIRVETSEVSPAVSKAIEKQDTKGMRIKHSEKEKKGEQLSPTSQRVMKPPSIINKTESSRESLRSQMPLQEENQQLISSQHITNEIENMHPEAIKMEGYTYRVEFEGELVMVIWLPKPWTSCFLPCRQSIWYSRVMTWGAVAHGWFREVSHAGGVLRCYLRTSDLCTFDTDYTKLEIEVEKMFLDLQRKIVAIQAEIATKDSIIIGLRRTTIGLGKTMEGLSIDIAETLAVAQNSPLTFINEAKPRSQKLVEYLETAWWKYALVIFGGIIVFLILMAMILAV